ncbi:MAG: hypothetical protein QNK19_12145 [Xanthomonadales bacterium]|nr:hypothetical protein [Xanthomonadales bacterium]
MRDESQQDSSIQPLLDEIRQKHGEALLAILVYGSWLRGKRDTMLDFYVLVEDYRTLDSAWQGWMCRLLPPNVYQIHHKKNEPETESSELRAKYALLTLSRFRKAMQHDFHSYFWARFAQPCEVLYVRDEASRAVLTGALNSAATTFVQRVVPAMGDNFSSSELWTHGLALTYQCELRTESSNRGESIYEFDPAYYDGVTSAFSRQNTSLSNAKDENLYSNQSNGFSRKFSLLTWWLRRVQGKLLSVLRLVKAAFTFNEPLEYLLWKIERHTGLYIEPTERQLKHPLIFAWPLLWRLHRQGAFR